VQIDLRSIGYLQDRDIGVVGVSPHDSCDDSIAAFKRAFPDQYRDITVG
jgi:hypothetical protein